MTHSVSTLETLLAAVRDWKNVNLADDELSRPYLLPMAAAVGAPNSQLAVVLARARNLPQSRWLVGIRSIEEALVTKDWNTVINLTEWVRRELVHASPPTPASRAISDLVHACSEGTPPTIASGLDLLISSERVAESTTRQAADALIEAATRTLPDDDITRDDIEKVSSASYRNLYIDRHRWDAKFIQEAVADVLRDMPEGVPISRTQSLNHWLEKMLRREVTFGEELSGEDRCVVELGVEAEHPDFRTFGNLMESFARLLEEVFSNFFPRSPLPAFQPLAGMQGSFVIQASIGGAHGTQSVEKMQAILAAVTAETPGDELRREVGALRQGLVRFFRAVEKQQSPVRTTTVAFGSARSVRAHRFSTADAARAQAWLETEEDADVGRRRALGTLVGADVHRSTFAAKIGADVVRGRATDSSILERAEIGRRYSFQLERTLEVEKSGRRSIQTTLVAMDEPEGMGLSRFEPSPADDDRLMTVLVPQSTIDGAFRFTEMLSLGSRPTAQTMGKANRTIGYYFASAKILDLVDRSGRLTKFGQVWIAKDEQTRWRRAAAKFEESPVARAWVQWTDKNALAEIDPETARAFLADVTELSSSTLDSRSGHLRRWLQALRKYLDAPNQVHGAV